MLQFVVVTELRGSMDIHLEGVSDGMRKQRSIGFVPSSMISSLKIVDLSLAQVSLSAAWSGVSMYCTNGPTVFGLQSSL
jgi:hypothetical protein